MKIDGGCLCGNISYEAEVDPETVGLCHCTDCQTLSGSAFRTAVPTKDQDFILKSGAPKTYVKTAESGTKRAQVFCPECGANIYSTSVGDGPKVFNLRVGTTNQRNDLPPKKQIWCRSAQAWLGDLGSVPRTEKQ